MLISGEELKNYINVSLIRGVLHVGACYLEESPLYHDEWGLDKEQVLWIEANTALVIQYPEGTRCINMIASDTAEEVPFYVATSIGASSLLPLGKHQELYPDIEYKYSVTKRTNTLYNAFTFFNLDINQFNFLNIDVQGAEMKVLRGLTDEYIQKMDYIYLEVSIEELYQGCCLLPELDSFLDNLGFTRVSIKMDQSNVWGDALWVKKELIF